MSGKAMRKVKKNINNQLRENQNWYDRRYNEDATQRADAQRILSITNENIRARNQQAAGNAAVMGGTEESVAAAKSANSSAMADAVSQIAVNAENRKDQIESEYLQTKNGLLDKLNNLEESKAKNIAQSIQGVAQAGAGIASAF